MAWDLNKQPQTEADFTDYFFTLINQPINGPANNFKQVMKQLYPWKGQMLVIPENVPGPGQQLPNNAPFYGLTQQTGGDGVPDARLWIPAAEPQTDENGNLWYTRYIQYVKDKPNGVHGVDFLWTWWYQSGNPYVPLGGNNGGGQVPSDTEQRLETLEAQMELANARILVLEDKVKVLEQNPKWPRTVAIKSKANNRFVAVEINHWTELLANRGEVAGEWEKFEFVVLEW